MVHYLVLIILIRLLLSFFQSTYCGGSISVQVCIFHLINPVPEHLSILCQHKLASFYAITLRIYISVLAMHILGHCHLG